MHDCEHVTPLHTHTKQHCLLPPLHINDNIAGHKNVYFPALVIELFLNKYNETISYNVFCVNDYVLWQLFSEALHYGVCAKLNNSLRHL